MQIIDMGLPRVEFSYFRYIANKAMKEIDGNSCAVYLQDQANKKRYCIRESIPYSELYGITKVIDLNKKEEQERINGQNNIGITYCSIRDKKTIVIDDVSLDNRWSGHQKQDSIDSFGLTAGSVGPVIVAPIFFCEEIIGVIWVARGKDRNTFSENDEDKLEKFLADISHQINETLYIDDLFEIDSSLFLEPELCQKIVNSITKLLKGKTYTSIFILRGGTKEGISKFCGISSTGSFKNINGKQITNQEAWNELCYHINLLDNTPKNYVEWVVKNKEALLINNVLSNIEQNAAMNSLNLHYFHKDIFSIVSKFENTADKIVSRLYLPIISRDRNIVVGLLEINKEGSLDLNCQITHLFEDYEIDALLSYQEKLSRVITNISFLDFLEMIDAYDNKETMLDFAVKETIKIVGGRGCSVFLFDYKTKFLELFSTTLDILKRKKIKYRVGEGLTGYIAERKKPIWFNSKDKFEGIDEGDQKPQSSEKTDHCETGEKIASKFAGVPLLRRTGELLGVMRIAKTESDTDFILSDIEILNLIARHLSKQIEGINQKEIQVKMYEVAEKSSKIGRNEIIHNFLTFLTHEDGLRFNRAIYFDYKENVLVGLAGIGPVHLKEAGTMQHDLEAQRISFEDTLNRFRYYGNFPNAKLQDKVFNLKLAITRNSIFGRENLMRFKEDPIIEAITIGNVLAPVYKLCPKFSNNCS